jgi:MFS family permease
LSSSARSGLRERFGNASFSFRPISSIRESRPAGADTRLTYSDLADPSLSEQRSLLRNKGFAALCAARADSSAGDQVAAVALVLLISKDHPATAVGGLLLAESLPMLLSTHAGVLADRVDARSLMVGCQLGQAVIFAIVTAWLPPYALLLALLVAASLLGTALRSATQVAVKATVSADQLMPANAMLGIALWSSMIVGPAVGGGSAAYGSAMAVFGAGMVVGSAVLVRWAKWRAERLLLASFVATAGGTAGLGLAPSLALVYPAQVVGGAANGVEVAAQTTLVQQRTPPAMLGRMSGALNSAVAVGFVVAYLGGGALVELTSPRAAFLIAAVGTLSAVAVAKPVWATPAT